MRQSEIEEPKYFQVYKDYVDPAVYVVIIVTGLILNGTLLLMFIRQKEIRTRPNIMIFNLAVCDILNIAANAPLHYFNKYDHASEDITSCGLQLAFRQFLRAVSALSLLALSIQRFCVTVPLLNRRVVECCGSSRLTLLYILFVWALALPVALPPSFIRDIYAYLCSSYKNPNSANLSTLCYTLFYCVVLPIFILGFNLATARRLKRSIMEIPGEVQNVELQELRKRSANVVMALALLYIISFTPFWVWNMAVYWGELERNSPLVLFTAYLTKYLLFLNACFNPIALYISSVTYRNLFRHYLCCLQQEENLEQDNGTNSSSVPGDYNEVVVRNG
ncbi:neuropeptide CCHamide-2 receptor-like [Periplaneta americana]|uniref:neuropeptide CCHamide-2 receptor-like n=1 Tax=Periplaneta americana TaxID=6978 RepID=UPI0037E808E0